MIRRVALVLCLASGAIASDVLLEAQSAEAQSAGRTIDPIPTVDIGGSLADPRDQLGLVGPVARLVDGRIVIVDRLVPAVRFYDANGNHLRDVGRAGDGPGEFRDPMALVSVADTLFVLDRVGRLTSFDSNGTVLDIARVTIEGQCDERYNARFGGLGADASVVVRCEERLFGRVRGEYRQTVGLLRLRRDGEIETLGGFPADSVRTDATGQPVPRPYVPGTPVLWADAGTRLFVASGDEPSVKAIAADGGRTTAIAVPARRRAVTPEDVDEAKADILRIGGTENDRRVVTEWVDGMPRASRTPAIRRLLAAKRELWVETWEQEDGGSWWVVLGFDGRVIERVLAPSATRLLAVGDDWVLGLWRDPFGVERVRLHAIRG